MGCLCITEDQVKRYKMGTKMGAAGAAVSGDLSLFVAGWATDKITDRLGYDVNLDVDRWKISLEKISDRSE